MSLDSDIFDTLKDLVSNRCYPQVAPQDAALPRITYTVAGSNHEHHLTGIGGLAYYDLQIDCWGSKNSESSDLADQVRQAIDVLDSPFVTSEVTGIVDNYEPPQNGKQFGIYRRTVFVTVAVEETLTRP